MKPLWGIADLIDFEYLLYLDDINTQKNGQDEHKHRDRDIYLQKIAPLTEGQKEPNESFLLHKWLTERQKQETEKADGIALPGKAWNGLYRISWWLLLILGFIIGAGLAKSSLDYSGTEPVNVLMYLLCIVVAQIGLYIILGVRSVYRLIRRLDLRSSLLYSPLCGLMVSSMLKLNKYFGKKMTGYQRLQMSAAQGIMREKLLTHGSCLLWAVFILLQMLAIGFNSGVLAATLLKVILSDIAFGWQTTLQVSEQIVLTLVKFIALPWSWLFPAEIAYPSLAHIKGSQMILKEGIYHLATKDLVSWWPFLCLAVLVYGILPRMALLFFGLVSLRRNMNRLQFKNIACKQIIQRMTTSLVTSQAPVLDHSTHPLSQGLEEETVEAGSYGTNNQGVLQNTAVALIPQELDGQCPLNTLQVMMQMRLGVTVQETIQTGNVGQNEQTILSQLEEKNIKSKIDNIVILQEAWQPPILEFLHFLKHVRSRLGASVPLYVALVGKPSLDTIFTPTKKEDLEMWRQKIRGMGEPDLQVFELVVAP
jgi:hypothetical protein